MVKINNEPYFENFPDSFWDLFVLVTASNSPDIMMPAYDRNRLYSIFFVTFLIINLYMFMAVFLAVVYNRFVLYFEAIVSGVHEAQI